MYFQYFIQLFVHSTTDLTLKFAWIEGTNIDENALIFLSKVTINEYMMPFNRHFYDSNASMPQLWIELNQYFITSTLYILEVTIAKVFIRK